MNKHAITLVRATFAWSMLLDIGWGMCDEYLPLAVCGILHTFGNVKSDNEISVKHINGGVGSSKLKSTDSRGQRSAKRSTKTVVLCSLFEVLACFNLWTTYSRWCRAHHAHFLVAAITALPVEASVTRNLYNRLRAAFNPMRLSDIHAIPPLEEVQGVSSFCNDSYCRQVKKLNTTFIT